LNNVERTVKIGDTSVHGVEIDWEKRDWKRIYTSEEETERVGKMLRLNGGPDYDPMTARLLAASSDKRKPTVRIKRIGTKLQGASSFQEEREKAEKAFRLFL
jgi:Ca2+-binding EF-hand superfamily protein